MKYWNLIIDSDYGEVVAYGCAAMAILLGMAACLAFPFVMCYLQSNGIIR
jgi:hypothetical protein